MPMLALTDEQVIKLVTELPQNKQEELLKVLLTQPWASWANLTQNAPE